MLLAYIKMCAADVEEERTLIVVIILLRIQHVYCIGAWKISTLILIKD